MKRRMIEFIFVLCMVIHGEIPCAAEECIIEDEIIVETIGESEEIILNNDIYEYRDDSENLGIQNEMEDEDNQEDINEEEINLIEEIIEAECVDYSAISDSDYGSVLATGNCGATKNDNLIWKVCDSDMDNIADTLIITGTGAMEDYHNRTTRPEAGVYTTVPWGAWCPTLKRLVLDDGITHIGDWAFAQLYSSYADYTDDFLGNFVIPDSVVSIGEYAFYFCTVSAKYCYVTRKLRLHQNDEPVKKSL